MTKEIKVRNPNFIGSPTYQTKNVKKLKDKHGRKGYQFEQATEPFSHGTWRIYRAFAAGFSQDERQKLDNIAK